MLKGKTPGVVYEARSLRKTIMDISPSFQIIEGPFIGEILPYEYCVVIEENEEVLNDKEWSEIRTKVDIMIAEWINEPHVGSVTADRQEFSKKLTDFIRKELTQQT